MDKQFYLERLKSLGIVAVVRAESREQASSIAKAVIDGGIKIIEITYTVPGATEAIKALADEYRDTDVIVGAGTVLDAETAEEAIDAGAMFVVSPCLVEEVVEVCKKHNVISMPGAMTVREAFMGIKSGGDIVKIFPGELFGPAIIKAFKGPLPFAQMMPTGGVSADNIADWIKAGAVAVGVGGSLTASASKGDYDTITKKASELVQKLALARGEKV